MKDLASRDPGTMDPEGPFLPKRKPYMRAAAVSLQGLPDPSYSWADLEGPQICHLSFYIFCGRSQKHKAPTNGTLNWSPGLIFGATCTIFRAGARPKAPGARRGPQKAENLPKTTAGFIPLSSLRSARIDFGSDCCRNLYADTAPAAPGPSADQLIRTTPSTDKSANP
jgi:hypothetical protein